MYVCVRGVATVRDAQRIKQDRTRVTQTRCKHSVFGVFWSFWSGTTVKKKKIKLSFSIPAEECAEGFLM